MICYSALKIRICRFSIQLCIFAPNPLITDTCKSFASIKLSCLHFGSRGESSLILYPPVSVILFYFRRQGSVPICCFPWKSSCVILLCLVAPVLHHNAQPLQVKSSKYRYQCHRRYQSLLKKTQTFPSQRKMLLIKYLQQ